MPTTMVIEKNALRIVLLFVSFVVKKMKTKMRLFGPNVCSATVCILVLLCKGARLGGKPQ